MKKICLVFSLFFLFLINVNAEDLTPNSEAAILIESTTGKVLYEKNADLKLAPASMTKIASLLLIMEAISNHQINLEDEVIISDNASSMGGSQIFLQTGEKYTVNELLKGIAIASGNDAVVAMAEKVSGSVDAFVKAMNDKAKILNLTNTHFENPHGLDHENHYTTARDMALLAQELLKHEKILEYTSIYEDYLKKPDGSSTWLVNTNRLVRFYEGVDGLKTGFTNTAGYCLTSTAKRNSLRLISVVMKSPTSDLRSKDTVNMLNYGFNTYKLDILIPKSQDLGEVSLEKGHILKTKVYLANDATILKKVDENQTKYDYNLVLNNTKIPLKANEKVGYLEIIDNEGNVIKEINVITKEEIKKASIFQLFNRLLTMLTSGLPI